MKKKHTFYSHWKWEQTLHHREQNRDRRNENGSHYKHQPAKAQRRNRRDNLLPPIRRRIRRVRPPLHHLKLHKKERQGSLPSGVPQEDHARVENPRKALTRIHIRPGLREPDRSPSRRHSRHRRHAVPRRTLLLRSRLPGRLPEPSAYGALPLIRVAAQPEPIRERAGLSELAEHVDGEEEREMEP